MNTSDRTDSIMLFLFGLAYAFFHIMPAMLPIVMTGPVAWGDFLDFFTPFTVIPVAYLLFRRIHEDLGFLNGYLSLSKVLLAGGFLLYIDGHGLHLSANAIARLIQNDQESMLFGAVYLFDEIISHFMWDGGVFIISLALILAAYKIKPTKKAGEALEGGTKVPPPRMSDLGSDRSGDPRGYAPFVAGQGASPGREGEAASRPKAGEALEGGTKVPPPRMKGSDLILVFLGAALYGFTFTVNGIEGQTVVMTFPAAFVGFLTGLLLYRKIRKVGGENPFLLFFLAAYLISLCLFVSWGLSRGGFPEFSELGWI